MSETDTEKIKAILKTLQEGKGKTEHDIEEDEKRRRRMKEVEDQVTQLEKSKKELEEQLVLAQKELEALKKTMESLEKSGEKTIQELQERVKKLEDDNTKKDEELKTQQADAQTEITWKELVGKQYRPDDADVIKPIIRKTILNQPRTAAELKLAMSKSATSRITLGGAGGEGDPAPTQEQEASLIKQFGIRPKVNSKFAQK